MLKNLANEKSQQYLQSVYKQLSDHWELPEKDWEENILAVVIIEVSNEGNIKYIYFEKPSVNIEFNFYVERALNKSNPLQCIHLKEIMSVSFFVFVLSLDKFKK